MSRFLPGNTLIGGILAIALLGAMHMSAALAGDTQVKHQHSSATPHDSASKPAAAAQGQSSHGKQMKHDAMDHGSINHSDMGHDMMSDAHKANQAEADSNHDH